MSIQRGDPYERGRQWVNEETRLNQDNLNNIENGIDEALNRKMTVNIDGSDIEKIIIGDGIRIEHKDEDPSTIIMSSQRVLFSSASAYEDSMLNPGDVCFIVDSPEIGITVDSNRNATITGMETSAIVNGTDITFDNISDVIVDSNRNATFRV